MYSRLKERKSTMDTDVNASSPPLVSDPPPTRELLGVQVSTLDMRGTVDFIEKLIAEGRGHVVTTVDSFGLVQAQEDSELRDIYQNCSLATADSSGVVWALGRKNTPVERVSGVDLVDELCKLSSRAGHRIFLLGSEPGVAELAAEKLNLKHPGCNIVGTRHGYFPVEDADIVAQEVAEFKPDILFVALGIPRQEKFIARTMEITGAKVAMGIGGSLDVFSGRAKRAPKFVQGMKMEWLWRLIQNPSKFSKVSRLPRFVWLVLRGKS